MRYQRYIMIYFCFLELEFSRFFGRIHHYHFLLRIIYIMELLPSCPRWAARISVGSREDFSFTASLSSENAFTQLLEQISGQYAVVVGSVRARPQIIARPEEAVQFIEANPMSPVVQAEASADGSGYFQRGVDVVGRSMGYRSHDGSDVPVGVARQGHDDRTGTIFAAFDRAGVPFVAP